MRPVRGAYGCNLRDVWYQTVDPPRIFHASVNALRASCVNRADGWQLGNLGVDHGLM